MEDYKTSLINYPNRYSEEENGTLFHINFLLGDMVGICGGVMDGEENILHVSGRRVHHHIERPTQKSRRLFTGEKYG